MAKEKTESEQIADGNAALALLKDPIFQQAIEAVKEDVTQQWKEGKDQRAREDAHAEFRAVDKIVTKLNGYTQNGEVVVRRQARAEQLKTQR